MLGFNNRVFIFIKTNQHKKEWADKFKKYLLEQKQVIGFYRISGTFDYLINVLAKDINDFDKFYQNLIENVVKILGPMTFPLLIASLNDIFTPLPPKSLTVVNPAISVTCANSSELNALSASFNVNSFI